MMVNSQILTGASLNETGDWNSISWSQCHRIVQRLQVRIVKATQEKRWNKVKALQRLLTHSFSGKALAVERVTGNKGKNTPGVDQEKWSTPCDKYQAIHSLRSKGYKALPLRRVLIPKSNAKMRPLGIPTLKDRAMQALYALALDPIAEVLGDEHSYGFRKERSTADAIEQCFTVLARGCAAEWILEADIEGCFDNISHEWLMNHIPLDKKILKEWLKAGYMDKNILHPTGSGTPQGGIISPLLANMALDGLGKLLQERYPMKISSRKPAHKVNFVRYCDDFIITGRTKEMLEKDILPLVESFLSERGLRLSKEKTHITHIEQGFDFLGQNVRKYKGKLLIKPSKKSVKTFLESIRDITKKNKMAVHDTLIQMLNPKIRGWCQYHRHVVSKATFSKLHHELWKISWKWATRRHPDKNAQWVKNKYYIHDSRSDWCFATKVKDPRSQEDKIISLYEPTRVPIKRHIKIQSKCNPYDPTWSEYLDKRAYLKVVGKLKREQLYRLWMKQTKLCPICNQSITLETGWKIDRIKEKSEGGENNFMNLMMRHPTCHKRVQKSKGENL